MSERNLKIEYITSSEATKKPTSQASRSAPHLKRWPSINST